jgi:hypothetical protein
MSDFIVALCQRGPHDFLVLEVFTEKGDALDYAERYAAGHGYVRKVRSRRSWKSLVGDGHELVVRERRW